MGSAGLGRGTPGSDRVSRWRGGRGSHPGRGQEGLSGKKNSMSCARGGGTWSCSTARSRGLGVPSVCPDGFLRIRGDLGEPGSPRRHQRHLHLQSTCAHSHPGAARVLAVSVQRGPGGITGEPSSASGLTLALQSLQGTVGMASACTLWDCWEGRGEAPLPGRLGLL